MPSAPVILSIFGLELNVVAGIADFAREVSRQRAGERGWRSVLCYSRIPADHVCRHLALPNVTIDEFPRPWISDFHNALIFCRLLRRYRPRIVHLHYTGFIGPYPWLARLHGVEKVFFTDHGSRPASHLPTRAPAWKRLATRIIDAPIDRILCISGFSRKCNLATGILPAGRYQVIYNGTDLSLARAANEDDIRKFREQYGIPAGRRIVLQVSWIIPEKGIPELIEAAAIILRQRRDIHFVIAGEGAYRQEYASRVEALGLSGSVVLTGNLDRSLPPGLPGSLAPAYASADVVCQLSRWHEGFGLTIIEAMSYAKPVIGTAVGGIPEIIVDGETGYIAPAGDAPAIADRILNLLSDPAAAARMGQAGRRRVEEMFDIRRTAAQILQAYGLHS